MRIIIKPLGAALMALVLGNSCFYLVSCSSKFQQLSPSVTLAKTSGGENIVSDSNWKFYTEDKATGAMQTASASPAGVLLTGFHVDVTNHTDKHWNIGVSHPLNAAFKANEPLKLQFWARAKAPTTIELSMQKNTPGFPSCFHKEYALGTEWKEYEESIEAMPMAKFESMLGVHCGYQNGWVEVVGVRLERAN